MSLKKIRKTRSRVLYYFVVDILLPVTESSSGWFFLRVPLSYRFQIYLSLLPKLLNRFLIAFLTRFAYIGRSNTARKESALLLSQEQKAADFIGIKYNNNKNKNWQNAFVISRDLLILRCAYFLYKKSFTIVHFPRIETDSGFL